MEQKRKEMNSLREVREYFKGIETKQIANESADYQFVKRSDGIMLQFANGEFKFYTDFEKFCKAAWNRVKKG